MRAQVAEATVSGQAVRLADSTQRLAALQEQADASQVEVKRLGDDIATLRDRLQSVQAESRDASATAAALSAARDAQQRLSTAALAYANTEADLSKTRSAMIDTSRDQIAAERAGLRTTSNRLVDEYNRLVRVHNQQVAVANAALANLKKLL
jgi:predicted  nucleic acid-binding Zn-ribbon protein